MAQSIETSSTHKRKKKALPNFIMSTDSEDANFDETLKNLQLLNAVAAVATSDQPSSSRIPVNPFQLPPACSSHHLHHQNDAIVKQIFGTRCECGAERSQQKVLPPANKHHHTSLEHGIINPTPFKHKAKGEKKVIVREAILKNIGKCVHQNLAKQSCVAKEQQQQQQRLSNTFLPAPSPLKPSRSENNLAAKGFNQEAGDDILDFRLLVAQCSELTLSNGGSKPTPDGGPNYSRTSFKTLRQPEIFASSSSSMAFIGPSRRNRRARQLKRYNSTSSLESDSSSSGGGGGNGSVLPAGLGRTLAGSQQQQQQSQQQSPNSNSSSPTASSASASASCSTQARLNGSTMPCDITIDEMASYFETLVHIPKKMSSMAEMMYI